MFPQGDSCTSCASLGTAVGEGVAVQGPKGERGDTGPTGEGKPGKNVREFYVNSFIIYILCIIYIS